ncbi:MAG: thioesterase family protein [bacterium]|nr:thioesterase family protein [bacterium]
MKKEERVRYVETDKMGVVHHSKYLWWFEVGRTEFLRSLGISYKEMEDAGVFIPVVEAYCKYIHPAQYDDQIYIMTTMKERTKVSIIFEYTIIEKSKKKVLVKGWTKHTFLNKDGKIIRLPENFMKVLEKSEKEERNKSA